MPHDETSGFRPHDVTMPQLGMAQDTGLLVNWLKSPGDEVAANDILFEVETDKSKMEVEAGRNGFLAATLAEAGEEVPVGDPVAIISDARPEAPVARSARDGGAPPAPAAPVPAEKDTTGAPAKPAAAAPAPKTPGAKGGAHPRLAQGAAAGAGTGSRPQPPRRGGPSPALPRRGPRCPAQDARDRTRRRALRSAAPPDGELRRGRPVGVRALGRRGAGPHPRRDPRGPCRCQPRRGRLRHRRGRTPRADAQLLGPARSQSLGGCRNRRRPPRSSFATCAEPRSRPLRWDRSRRRC